MMYKLVGQKVDNRRCGNDTRGTFRSLDAALTCNNGQPAQCRSNRRYQEAFPRR